MNNVLRAFAIFASIVLLTEAAEAGFPKTYVKKCAKDAVVAGRVCMDTYEASVWQVPDPTGANRGLVNNILKGKATAADLGAAGATQLGTSSDNYTCSDGGQDCTGNIYAVSLAGVTPSAYVTWFQAQGACANSGKRLPTNAEWQVAANGTPDTGGSDDGSTTCNTDGLGPALTPTGARSACVSVRGAYDMVGNLDEWVADWVPRSDGCPGWDYLGSDDAMCLAGADATAGPGAPTRGGWYAGGALDGPVAVHAGIVPYSSTLFVGFRCAR